MTTEDNHKGGQENESSNSNIIKEKHDALEASVNNVSSFLMNDWYRELNSQRKIGREEFAEATASSLYTAASQVSNKKRSSDDDVRHDDHDALFKRSQRQMSLSNIMEKNAATKIRDTFLAEFRKELDDEESELYTTSILKGTARKIVQTCRLMEDITPTNASLGDEILNEETALCKYNELFDPRDSFLYTATMQNSDPIYKRSSSKQMEVLLNVSKMSWPNMSREWLHDSLLEDFPSSEDEEYEEGVKSSLWSKDPIISKRGSLWMLDENAIR